MYQALVVSPAAAAPPADVGASAPPLTSGGRHGLDALPCRSTRNLEPTRTQYVPALAAAVMTVVPVAGPVGTPLGQPVGVPAPDRSAFAATAACDLESARG